MHLVRTERKEARRRHPHPTTQAGLNELLGEYKTATDFRVRSVKILDALLAADHPVRVAAFDNLLKSLDMTLVPGHPRMLPLEESLMWQRLGLDRAARLHDRRRMQMEDRVELSAALSRVACSLTEQGRFPVCIMVLVEHGTHMPRLQNVNALGKLAFRTRSSNSPLTFWFTCRGACLTRSVRKSSPPTIPAPPPRHSPRIRTHLGLCHVVAGGNCGSRDVHVAAMQ